MSLSDPLSPSLAPCRGIAVARAHVRYFHCDCSSAEVAKTRLQLQGELMKGGGEKVYKNVFDVLIKTWRNEGLRGVQRGLGPAVCPPRDAFPPLLRAC